MTITEIRSFVKEAGRKIRVDHIGDITDIIADDRGTMAIATHDLQLVDKMRDLGAEITDESSGTFGRAVVELLEDRGLQDCSTTRIRIETDSAPRTILLPVDDSGDYGDPVCVSTKKLTVFKAERIWGSSHLKPLVIKGADYWSLVFPVRVDRDAPWVAPMRYIGRQL